MRSTTRTRLRSVRGSGRWRSTRTLTCKPWSVTAADLDSLRQTGRSEKPLLDVMGIACLFSFMPRLADGLGAAIEGRKAAALRPSTRETRSSAAAASTGLC